MWYASGVVAVCLLASTAFASPPSSCTVHYGRKSVKPIPTSQYTRTRTITPTVIVTSLRTTTITPSPTTTTTTITDTETDTTTVTSTDTFTDTETDTTTISITLDTQTVTATTITTTSTTSTSTTTLGTTSGFTPIRSSVPDSSYNGAFGGPSKRSLGRSLKRSVGGASGPDGLQDVEERGFRNKKPNCLGPSKFTTSVGCTKTVTTYAPTFTWTWKPARTTTVTAPTSTVTATSETTTTTTTTDVLDAETTITTTTTSSITSTSSPVTTTTSTSTVTNTAMATATAYSQCNSDNFANARGGRQGVGVSGNANAERQFPNINNALDCCIQCASSGSACDFDLYTAQSGGCYTFAGSSFALYQEASLDWVVNNGAYAIAPA